MRGKALALEALKRIKEDPKSWQQRYWRCGSSCCFAGHVVALAGGKWTQTHQDGDNPFAVNVTGLGIAKPTENPKNLFVAIAAERLLEIDDHDSVMLFDPDNTLEELEDLIESDVRWEGEFSWDEEE